MSKIYALLIILLIGCANLSPPTTSWEKANYKEIAGLVEIATGWGRAHLCTGVLITNDAVLTAAHCADFPAEDLYIVYGCNDISYDSCQRVPVRKVVKHPEWKKEYVFADDLAILFINKDITEIGLATIEDKNDLEEGLSVLAFGFGNRNDQSGILYYGRGRIRRDYEKEIVVFMPGKLDPNPGDSGGPVFVLSNGVWKVVGILSRAQWESTTKKQKFEHSGNAIYTKPMAYIGWIKQTINEDN